MILLTGTSNNKLTKQISKNLNIKVHETVTRFADGEVKPKIPVHVAKKQVFVIQSTSPPVNENLMELFLIVDAAHRAGANEINAVIPYFGYARQDRKDVSRVPISSALIAKYLKVAGVTRIISVDIHSDQQQGFFDGRWDSLYASYVMIPELRKLKLKNPILVSPDKGGVPRARAYAKFLDTNEIAIVIKERDTKLKNVSKALSLIGDVKGKDAILTDDMIDTAGTMQNAAKMLKENGANSIYISTAHGLFSPPALDRLNQEYIDKIFVTDTIEQPKEITTNKKFKIVSVAPMLSKAIKITATGRSLSSALIL